MTEESQRSPKELGALYLKGTAMGAADLVPGVSGGTVAFITGIYDELVSSIASFSPGLIGTFRRQGFIGVWQAINGKFLTFLFAGILTSVVAFSKAIKYLLVAEPLIVWSLFFGLIAASSIILAKEVGRWSVGPIISLLMGIAVGYLITAMSPSQLPFEGAADYWKLIPVGAIAFSAMILPGISGSFLLLLMGMYQVIITALSEQNVLLLLTFMVGGALGLITFSRVLKVLLAKQRGVTLALLTGFMLGAMTKVWPWRVTTEFWTDRHGKTRPLLEEAVLPAQFEAATGQSPEVMICILFMVLGIGLAFLPSLFAKKEAH